MNKLTNRLIVLTLMLVVIPFFLSPFVYADSFSTGIDRAITWGTTRGGLAKLPIFSFSGPSVIGNILIFLSNLAYAVAVVAIVVGGLMYVLSAGDENKISRAKRIILFAVLGLVIMLARYVITGIVYSWLGIGVTPKVAANVVIWVLNNIITFLQAIVTTAAVLAIIWGGFRYISAVGDESKTTKAKQTIVTAILGLVVVYIAKAITLTIYRILNGVAGAATPFVNMIGNAISFILTFISIVAVAAFIYGGITYLTSGGSDEKVQRGKKIIIYAIVGIIIILVSAAIVNTVLSL